jgi:hypothetical protein
VDRKTVHYSHRQLFPVVGCTQLFDRSFQGFGGRYVRRFHVNYNPWPRHGVSIRQEKGFVGAHIDSWDFGSDSPSLSGGRSKEELNVARVPTVRSVSLTLINHSAFESPGRGPHREALLIIALVFSALCANGFADWNWLSFSASRPGQCSTGEQEVDIPVIGKN